METYQVTANAVIIVEAASEEEAADLVSEMLREVAYTVLIEEVAG